MLSDFAIDEIVEPITFKIQTHHGALLAFTSETRQKVIDILARQVTHDNNDSVRLVALYFLAKTLKSVAAIHILASNGYGEDAGILARSLFEIWLNFEYIIMNESQDRASRFIQNSAITRERDLRGLDSGQHPIARQIDTLVREDIARGAEQARLLHDFAKGEPTWSGQSVREMAEEVDKQKQDSNKSALNDYLVEYRFLSDHAHANAPASKSYVFESDKGLLVSYLPSAYMVPEALLTATDRLIRIADLAIRVLKLEGLEELRGLGQKLDNISKDLGLQEHAVPNPVS
ncbi:hypothetical protein HY524_00395 [Candidatus Berkelbacteria bacterium]|nr:hypothetical protein [Candidatus Berkelbacteria bacterium]